VRASEPSRQQTENRLLLDEVARRAAELSPAMEAADRLLSVHRILRDQLEVEATSMLLEPNPHAARELDIFRDQLDRRIGLIDEAVLRPRPDHLYWLNLERRSGRPLVLAATTQSGQTLQERALKHKRTAVFTSASLSVGESFDFFKRGVGMTEDAYELVLPSPFDYLSQALICLPSDVRDLEDRAFLDQATAVVSGIGRALGGRTMVLFTAHQQLREMADRLKPRLTPTGIDVMAQNVDGTRRQLLQRFQEDARAVLLGTSSFWEGIDIPGGALSCVVIVRLPFRVPTDPVQLARTAGSGDAFAEHTLPEAVLRLKQGFGRLIRRRTDRGAVVLLDHRIADRAYGQAFLDALPRAAVELGPASAVPAAVARWIAAG
jgi:DNA polymerase-3 subunit epsilon/ATP-dependent DNA helicase DinG